MSGLEWLQALSDRLFGRVPVWLDESDMRRQQTRLWQSLAHDMSEMVRARRFPQCAAPG